MIQVMTYRFGCASRKKERYGFTIVELLIVIVVIAILAAITIVAYNGIQARAHDSVRASDMTTIETALQSYAVIHGGVPAPDAYASDTSMSGWDISTNSDWLTFLRSTDGTQPVEANPHKETSDPLDDGNVLYFYYCGDASWWAALDGKPTVYIGYHKEDGELVSRKFNVGQCLTSVPI